MQENQPINTPNFNEANLSEVNVVNTKNNTLLYLILGLLVVFLILTFFYLGMMFGKNQSNVSNNTDQTEIKENVDKNEGSENQEDNYVATKDEGEVNTPISQIISLPNETMHYYNNDFGFLIRYPKYNKGLDSCVPSPDPENGKRELDVFEDLENNTIFISEKVDVFAPHKNTTEIDYSKCTMTENNLERLKNTTRWKVSFMYSKINGKEDLDKLASKMFSPNELKCYAGKQTYNPNGYFDIELSDKDGNKGTFDNGCPTNFAYTFAYNKEKGIAIISSGAQEPHFWGTNGQYNVQVGF